MARSPLADLDGLPWLREQAERLEQLRLRANRMLVETRLALGEHAQLLPELEALTRDHPFDEQLHAQLMLALYRSGRQADALGVYRHLRVVVVEDIHWADEATLDLLRYLSRRLRDTTVLLIVTYRDDGRAAGDPLRVALGDLASQRCTRRVGLAPLSTDAVRKLASGSGLSASELYRLTGGNPFYVTEVLRAGMEEVPPSARDAVLARAALLSGGSREVLDVAALTGSRVEARLLESITGCPPSVLDELLESGLLVGDGACVRFRHEIARLTVAQAVAGHRGQAIHGLVLAALRDFGCDDDARIAFHAEAAGDGAAVLRYAPAAARRAARLSSHREAAAQYERALRFSGGADPAVLAGLYEGLADEVSLLDRWHDAETAGERALALWREAGDRLREGDALRRLSCIRSNMCRGREAVVAVEAAVSALEALGPSVELARAYATFANQRMLYADHDAAIDLAVQAQELATRFGATDVHSDALNTQAAAPRPRAWTGPGRCAARSTSRWPGATTGRRRALTPTCAEFTPTSGSSPRPSGTWCRPPPTAPSTTSPRTRPACAASRPASWNAPVAGTRPSR